MNAVFVDTSGLMSVMAAEDRFHSVADGIWKALLESGVPLLTTNYVLVETHALLQRRYGLSCVAALETNAVPAMEVHWVTRDLHQAAVTAMLAANRRELSLVDCVSFAVMRELGINAAFTLDRHFAEQGFEVTPAQGQ